MKLVNFFLFVTILYSTHQKCQNGENVLKFYKTRGCYRSKGAIFGWKSVTNLKECVKFAQNRRGMAFNYSPPEMSSGWKVRNCQVLACPEPENSVDFVLDPEFDYYTAFGDTNITSDSICIKNVGLFKLFKEKMNYTSAAIFCNNLGGDLADVLTESRTNSLSVLVKTLRNWYKAAYVGLDDMAQEGVFENPAGGKLECGFFRAWAVGHPRPDHKKEDCVILDEDRTWRSINCKIKQPFICELYSSPPVIHLLEYKYKNCDKIILKEAKKKCLENNEVFKLFNESSRIDQCALINNFD